MVTNLCHLSGSGNLGNLSEYWRVERDNFMEPTQFTQVPQAGDRETNCDLREYPVEKVVDMRYRMGTDKEYLLKWKGYPASENTWEPEDHLNCPRLVKEFHTKVTKWKERQKQYPLSLPEMKLPEITEYCKSQNENKAQVNICLARK